MCIVEAKHLPDPYNDKMNGYVIMRKFRGDYKSLIAMDGKTYRLGQTYGAVDAFDALSGLASLMGKYRPGFNIFLDRDQAIKAFKDLRERTSNNIDNLHECVVLFAQFNQVEIRGVSRFPQTITTKQQESYVAVARTRRLEYEIRRSDYYV